MKRLGGMIAAGLMLLGIAAPALCFSPAPCASIVSSEGDLTISWQARVFVNEAQFRLYRVESSGSEVLLEQRSADTGIRKFTYIENAQGARQALGFRLCVLDAQGSERTLGVIEVVQIEMDAENTIAGPGTNNSPGLSVSCVLINDPSEQARDVPATNLGLGDLETVPAPRRLLRGYTPETSAKNPRLRPTINYDLKEKENEKVLYRTDRHWHLDRRAAHFCPDPADREF